MKSLRAANEAPIPGYRLLERLGQGGFGEVWKCEAPGGLLKAIKFVCGKSGRVRPGSNADQELRALHLIKAISHPFLLSIERIETLHNGDLAKVSELAECSLHDVLEGHRQAGRPGLPRAEALSYLLEAAEALDLINQEHGLQHLDVKPRNLFLIQRHVKVGDFGLVASLAPRRSSRSASPSTPTSSASPSPTTSCSRGTWSSRGRTSAARSTSSPRPSRTCRG
jgi:eukaryotic-like serine/threonine-protein kinase